MMTSMSAGEVAGIVCGIVFGLVFIVTCIISAVKAVKDRKRIKQRIAERARIKEEAKLITRRQKMESSIEDKNTIITDHVTSDRNKLTVNGQPASCSYSKADEPTTYLSTNGVDNLTYAHSRTDMELANHQNKSNITAEPHLFPQKLLVPSKRTLSSDMFDTRRMRGSGLGHLSAECLAVQKILRRHSYEVAVCENSWMPIEPPRFASSRSIIQTYNFGDRAGVRTSTVGFVNRAYDKDLHAKT